MQIQLIARVTRRLLFTVKLHIMKKKKKSTARNVFKVEEERRGVTQGVWDRWGRWGEWREEEAGRVNWADT